MQRGLPLRGKINARPGPKSGWKGGEELENRLKEVRQSKGVNQSQLAKRSGISRYNIYLIEKNKGQNVMFSTMKALSDALGVSIEDIFFE